MRIHIYTKMLIYTYAQDENSYRYKDDNTYILSHSEVTCIYPDDNTYIRTEW